MIAMALLPGSFIQGSVAPQALKGLVASAQGGEECWLLNKISSFNVPVKIRSFPKEASEALREAQDITHSFVLSLHKSSHMGFSAAALFVLFPRLILRPLPEGC